jgi:uncharacterized membrane-anchored protein
MRASWVLWCIALLVVATAGMAVAGTEKPPPAKAKAGPAADKALAPGDKPGAVELQGEDAEAKRQGDDPVADRLVSVPHIVGPKLVDLGHHAQIDLPEGMNLLERMAAQELLRKGGNAADYVVAAIVPASAGAHWLVVIEVEDVGYVSDDDAGELDAREMLDQFKTGTLEQNKKRVAMGVPELFVDGWSESPRYDRAKRHLVWGLKAHDTGGKVVNFFTRFLGRSGYLSVDLIDEPSTIEASKAQALSILTAVHFTPGFRYEDHIGSDRDSGLGLKALVLGGAGVVIAKKTGILIAILLALKKAFVVVIAAIGGFFKWLFGRRKREPDVVLTTSDVPLAAPPPPPDPGEPPAG